MRICIPVEEDRGLDSAICAHFGAAPAFLIVDTDQGSCSAIVNDNDHHGHGKCVPVTLLEGEQIDGMIVGGIGRGALNKLAAAQIRVYRAEHATVRETVAAFQSGTLSPMELDMACAQHGHHHH